MELLRDTRTKVFESLFKDFIIKKSHPCIMAQTAFKMDQVTFKEYGRMGTHKAAVRILKDLKLYLNNYNFESNQFETFIAIFPNENISDEKTFEDKLWQQLQKIHSLDKIPWDDKVSNDPKDGNFSFSILGHSFYIVGLHPNSSRKARQSPCPALVFNLHSQFEELRNMGSYIKVRDRIRKRDKKLQGSINPVLKDFGQASEALQYSGRNVEDNWKCPFHSKNMKE